MLFGLRSLMFVVDVVGVWLLCCVVLWMQMWMCRCILEVLCGECVLMLMVHDYLLSFSNLCS